MTVLVVPEGFTVSLLFCTAVDFRSVTDEKDGWRCLMALLSSFPSSHSLPPSILHPVVLVVLSFHYPTKKLIKLLSLSSRAEITSEIFVLRKVSLSEMLRKKQNVCNIFGIGFFDIQYMCR